MLLGLLSTLIWGWQYTTGRLIFGESLESADPYFLNMVKFFSGSLTLVPFLFLDNGWKKVRQACKEDLLPFFLLAIFGVMAEGFLALYSLQYTTAARGSLLCNMSPVFTVIVAAIATRKCPDWGKWVGMVLGVVGLMLVLSTQASDMYDDKPYTLPGDIMALASGLAWAIYTVYGSWTSQKYCGIPCTAITLFIAGCAMAGVCIIRGSDFTPALCWQAWVGTLFLGICASGLGIALWSMAIGMADPAALGAYGYLSALIALFLARLFSKEHFTWQFLVAFALIMGAIFLMNREEKKP